MTKLRLLTYADEKYEQAQAKLCTHAVSLGIFDRVTALVRENILPTDFYKENKYVLDKPKGAGYALWKPYLILETLKKMDEGDILLYIDSADWIHNADNMREAILLKMESNHLLLTAGAFKNSDWTKRDVFVYMGADSPEYWDAIQLEAGIGLFKNTEKTREFVEIWLRYCKVSAIITEDPNICNLPNLPGFKEHRYDQSILTVLAIKHGIQPSDFLRQFITCNVNNA